MRRAKSGARKGRREGTGKGEDEYRGHFCAKCGKKAGECEHRSYFSFLGEHGEFVVAE